MNNKIYLLGQFILFLKLDTTTIIFYLLLMGGGTGVHPNPNYTIQNKILKFEDDRWIEVSQMISPRYLHAVSTITVDQVLERGCHSSSSTHTFFSVPIFFQLLYLLLSTQ